MTARLLRAGAIAIAAAAAIDPPVTINARVRPRVALQMDPRASMPAAARAAHDALRDDLRHDFDVVTGSDAEAAALVVFGSSYPERLPPEGQRVFTVTAAPGASEPDVRIAAVRAPGEVPRGTLIHVEVDVAAANTAGAASTVTVGVGPTRVEVARATHMWTKSSERWRASIDVAPTGTPPWMLHVNVSVLPGERAVADNAADVVVSALEPLKVLVYEPRPSWPGTFVRRALESDSRFAVAGISYPSRRVQVTSGDVRALQSVDLEGIDAIVVGGLDGLTHADAALLERFMREREGAVILLPDSRNDLRTASQWLSLPAASEVLIDKPAALTAASPLPPFAVSEMLTFARAPQIRVLARTSGSDAPVVVATPYGGGHLLISGALDAWRYRADDRAAFDRFWQAAIAGAATMAAPPVAVRIVPAVIAIGEEARVHVRVRRAAFGLGASEPMRVSATVNGIDPLRLWPGTAMDTFVGTFTAPRTEGDARVQITVDAAAGRSAQAVALVGRDVRAASPAGAPLSMLAASHGGVNVPAENTGELARRLRHDIAAPPARVERRPMRSTWWLLPFTACLAGEWWIRRRGGLR